MGLQLLGQLAPPFPKAGIQVKHAAPASESESRRPERRRGIVPPLLSDPFVPVQRFAASVLVGRWGRRRQPPAGMEKRSPILTAGKPDSSAPAVAPAVQKERLDSIVPFCGIVQV